MKGINYNEKELLHSNPHTGLAFNLAKICQCKNSLLKSNLAKIKFPLVFPQINTKDNIRFPKIPYKQRTKHAAFLGI